MKKILLTCLFAIGMISLSNAQCTPGPEYGNGVYPDTITNFVLGCKDVPYEQIISIKVPADTTIDTTLLGQNLTINAVFNYIEILNLQGLPSGYSLACNPNDCVFPGNDVGCAVISGTTSDVGTYNLTFELNADLSAVTPFGSISIEQPYTLESYKIIVEDCGSSGILEESKNATVAIYPNPTSDVVTISNLSQYGVKNIHFYTSEGKAVKTFFTESESVSIQASDFPSGIYFVKIMQNGGQETIRLVIE